MRLTINLLFIMSVTYFTGYAQQPNKPQYVIAPAENSFLAVASQPECPLKIENARMLLNVEDNPPIIYQYRLINRGAKPIQSYTIVAWQSGGTGGTLGGRAPTDGRRLLMPGGIVPNKPDPSVEIVPLTAKSRTKLGLDGSMKHVTVLLVEHITFSDGSTYDYRRISQALVDFLEKLDP